jgi:hypothetical protein
MQRDDTSCRETEQPVRKERNGPRRTTRSKSGLSRPVTDQHSQPFAIYNKAGQGAETPNLPLPIAAAASWR